MKRFSVAPSPSEPSPERWQACDRKRTYPTKGAARDGHDGKVYRCRYCRQWHRTHHDARSTKRAREKRPDFH